MDYSKYSAKPLVLGLLSLILSFNILSVPIAYIISILGTVIGYKAIKVSGKTGFVLSLIAMIISSIMLFFIINGIAVINLFKNELLK